MKTSSTDVEGDVGNSKDATWGGARRGAGRSTAIPSGSGTKEKITVNIGSDQLDGLRALHPRLAEATPQDLVRAAVWLALGEDLDRLTS
ncbi:hypothetical protein [Deinococcus sp. 23YEL01]|uniref:hypothetical protein n=1 Tax=Deinococcus sp. 23YEL01 TaxID=2745871 RepID=UPI001E4813C7|nr:hypothetical protein [Deinococcus sp. 23YEL01]MCD0168630.1 hypothetical protein [Deinococcus sp. 23YEL01]